jgi:GNAT superfamily N-acetyltransferase
MTFKFITLTPLHLADYATLTEMFGWPFTKEDLGFALSHGTGIAVQSKGRFSGAGLCWKLGDDLASLGHVAIRPEMQGQGIGRALVTQLINQLADRSILLCATAAGEPLYRLLGFERIGTIHQHQGQYQPMQLGSRRPTSHCVVPLESNLITQAIALDGAAVGGMRPDTISAVIKMGEAKAIVDGDRLCAFAVRRRFGRGQVIGPIVAASEEQAMALCSALVQPGFLRVDRPEYAANFGHYLIQIGLQETAGESPLMRRGDAARGSPHAKTFGLASQALL